MHLNYFSSSFLLFVLIFFMVDIPMSLCDNNETSYYVDCFDRQFECGDLRVYRYPFWGNGRPEYCGDSDFELKCQNNATQIQLMNETYRVLRINEYDKSMRIARSDLWDDVCPSRFVNTTIQQDDDNTRFSINYEENTFLTLLFGCPDDLNLPKNVSNPTCQIHDGNNNNTAIYISYYDDEFSDHQIQIPRLQNRGTCNVSITVPVLRTATVALNGEDLSALPRVLRAGFDISWYTDDAFMRCRSCQSSGPGGLCGRKPATLDQFICFCRDGRSESTECSVVGSKLRLKIGIGIGVAGTFIIVVVIVFFILRRKYSLGNSIVFWKKKTKNSQNVEVFLKKHGTLAPKRYNYSDIKKMTNSFKEKLGQGAYGGVFKGKLLDGRMVAVKVLSETKGNGEEFINEVASISRTSHVNIVSLFGFCVEDPKRALVYEFMPNGSLEKFIYEEKLVKTHLPLGWEMLYKIAIGIAHGLDYLHSGCNTRILHFDIKPHNILLDQDFCPKISDFGLAKLCLVKESIISMIGARGTPGYIAPELFSRNFGGVSHKSDVYSYGMMVLEMVGKRKNIDAEVTNISEIYFPHWIYNHLDLCDENLGLHGVATIEEKEIARKMILVGLWCIQIDPLNRPSMSKVLEMLEGNVEALQIPPKPFLSSPPREQEGSSSTLQPLQDGVQEIEEH